MPEDLEPAPPPAEPSTVALNGWRNFRIGQTLVLNGCEFKLHKITKKDLIFRSQSRMVPVKRK